MNYGQNDPRMPWYGYVIANALVWLFVALVFTASKYGWFSTVQGTIDRSGVGSLLIFIPLVFLIASIYDYIYDRIARRSDAKEVEPENVNEADQLIPGFDSGVSKKNTQ